jgi:hypothetical protein
VLVDPEVVRRKFERELTLWQENAAAYRRRGWLLLKAAELQVEVGFLAPLPLGGPALPAMPACVRIDFSDYDLQPPSVEFIDPVTGDFAPPVVQALIDTDEGPRDLVVQNHPDSGRPFFCVPGVREYHAHPQHAGDSWLLHRSGGAGSLATICDRVWRSMARSLLGIHLQLQTLPGGLQLQLRAQSAPGEVAPEMWEQARRQQAAAAGAGQPLPAEVLAALGLAPAPEAS